MKLLIETQYLPPIATFSAIKSCTHICFEAQEHYQKRSFRNKCDIASANGLLSLTIPLLSGKNAQTPIQEVRISNAERWQAQHWQTLRSAYGRAPFFEYYADYFQAFYEKPYEQLWTFNQAQFLLLVKLLKLDVSVSFTEIYEKEVSTNEYLDFRNKLTNRATDFDVKTKKYPQLFEDRFGFLPNLSIIDLLFCMGPQTKDYL
jgi:hypothetical protein